MSGLIVPMSLLLYVVLPIWMLSRGWPARAGLAMVVAALLPWMVWYLAVPEPWGPGAGLAALLTALMLLVALVPLLIGVILSVLRFARLRRSAGG